MLSMENTNGYTQNEIDLMNKKVNRLFNQTFDKEEQFLMTDEERNNAIRWAEHMILKEYRGA